ncbi:MAG: DUF3021 domain-containing protein [Oscillospiraceae bacterium]|nr:DUF3021 domain-containing protein [Oscillospiraceae bacterium]
MKFFSYLVKYFTYITTGIVFVFIAILLIGDHDGLSREELIQIPCAGFATALVTTVLLVGKWEFPVAFGFRIALHYLMMLAMMIVIGILFEWIEFDLAGIITMVIATAAVYIFTFAVTYISVKNEADELNSALKKKRSEK